MRTIQHAWESFAAAVLSPDAGAVQRREMRRAFYAGAHATLTVMRGLGEPEVSEDAGVAVLESLSQESQAFAVAVTQGRA